METSQNEQLTPLLFFVTSFLETSAIKCLFTLGCGRSGRTTKSLTRRVSATTHEMVHSQGEARGRSGAKPRRREDAMTRVQSGRY
jgi:hypothetical protein